VYERIVVGTDGSDTASEAVQHALALAHAVGAEVHLVTAWSRIPALALAGATVTPSITEVDDGAWIAPLHEELAAGADCTCVSHAVEAPAVQALLEVAEAVGADLLVVGNRGMHGLRGKLGSVPNTIAHKAPCAVLLVPTT
jgi:nucleotide-binding universal stress UspA family protein